MPAMSATRDGSQAPPLAALSIRDPSELLLMKEVLDSLTTTLRERLVSPLAGAFIVSWLIINYKVVVVLTSGMKPHVKFPYIEDVIWRDSYGLWMNSLVYPAIAALLYILIYPWPARWLLKYSLYQQNITKLMKITVEGNHPVTREELEEAKQKWAEKFRKQGEAIQRLEVQIEDEQKKSEDIAQAEQRMTTRANQLALELDMVKGDSSKISEEVEDLKFQLSEAERVVKEKNELISRLEDAFQSELEARMLAEKQVAHGSAVKAVSDLLKKSDGNDSGKSGLAESIEARELTAEVVRAFITGLSKFYKIPKKPTPELTNRLVRVVISFDKSDADVFWRQIGSVKFSLEEFSSEAQKSIRIAFLA